MDVRSERITRSCVGATTATVRHPRPAGEFAAVAVGGSYSCALRTDGTVACWGENKDGRTDAPDGTYTDLAAGRVHPCAVGTDGTIRCWGRADVQYATGSGYQSTDRPPYGAFTDVSLSQSLGCGVRTDQSIVCWGLVRGLGSVIPSGSFVAVDINRWLEACALGSDGAITCWGVDEGSRVTDAPDGGEYVSVVTGERHACALKSDQTIVCWGDRDDPQQGNEVRGDGLADAPDGKFRAIAAARRQTCALRQDDTYTCWGSGTPVEIGRASGNGSGSSSGDGAGLFSDVSSGAFYSDAVDALAGSGLFEGTECAAGRLCPDEVIDRKTMAVWTVRVVDGQDPPAVSVSGFTDVDPDGFHASFVERMAELGVTLGCGDGTRFCPDGTVTRAQMAVFLARAFKLADAPNPGFSDVAQGVWFYDQVAALAASGITAGCGDGTAFCPRRSTTRAQMAVFLARATGVVELPPPVERRTAAGISGDLISISSAHGCAVRTDHTITCWGDNTHGQATPPSGEFAAVAVEDTYSCAIRTDGTVTCWGENKDGRTDAPDGTYTDLAAGYVHPCALHADGTIRCWGRAVDAYSGNQRTDRPPSGTFTDISLSSNFGCAVRTDQSIVCWGWLERLGTVPVGSFAAVDIQQFHACALRSDHTIACWGANLSGQADAPDGEYLSVVTGALHSCGLKADQTIVCWGDRDDPQRVGVGNVRSYGLTDAPAGVFRAIAATYMQTCALRHDNTHTCWGGDTPVEPDTAVDTEEGTVVEVIVSPGSSTITEGTAFSYLMVLSAEPSAPIVVTVDVPAGSDVSVDTATLTFDPTDWSVPQFVVVTVRHDDDSDDERVRITHTVTNAAPPYDTLLVPTFVVKISDDDDDTDSPVGATEPPGRVQNVQIEWNESDEKLRVSWDAPDDGGAVDGYAIDRAVVGSSFPDVEGRTGAEFVRTYRARRNFHDFQLSWGGFDQVGRGAFSVTLDAEFPADGVVDETWAPGLAQTERVRVVTYNDAGFSVSDSLSVPTRAARVHHTLQDNIETLINEHGSRVTWLREIGHYIRGLQTRPEPGFEFEVQRFFFTDIDTTTGHPGGWALLDRGPEECISQHWRQEPICGLDGLAVSVVDYEGGTDSFYVVAPHELAHIYTLANDAPSNLLAIAAGHLYLLNLLQLDPSWRPDSVDYNSHPCNTSEIYADTAADMVYEHTLEGAPYRSKWRRCNVEGSANHWQDHITIIRETLGGTVPEWFYQTYREDGVTWNLDRLWSDVASLTSLWDPNLSNIEGAFLRYALRNEFGGYCTDRETRLGTFDGNPWRDGGCAKSTQPNELVSVTLAVGASAQGQPNCSSEHCKHLSIALEAPTGYYDIECWAGGSEPWFSGRWHWPASPLWDEGGCWTHPGGEAVWVTVSPTDSNRKVKSNEVTWGQDTQPTQPTTDDEPTPDKTPPPPAGTATIAAGETHSCGIREDGTAVCWGDNSYGQADAPSATFTTISAGGGHSCGIREDGTAVCWGDNSYGQADAPSATFTTISAGGTHSCGIRADGTAACWGSNDNGRADAPSGTFTTISAGSVHSCGIREDGTAVCWGGYRYGDGREDAPSATFTTISAGGTHSCGIREDGTAVCWGDNRLGQADAPSATFTTISAGGTHSCGIREDGTAVCWGDNRLGQADAPSATFTTISAGATHSCGIREDGTAVCWGYNDNGQADAPSGTLNQPTKPRPTP